MISYFQIKNYRSIADAIVDLRYGEGKAPNGYQSSPRLAFLNEEGCRERLVPCLALFGSNANGKTNLLRAMATLQTAIANSRIDVRALYDPNRIVTFHDSTEFVLGFVHAAAKYEYRLAYSDQGVLSEQLTCDGKNVFCLEGHNHDFKSIATKMPYTVDALEEIFKVECCEGEGRWVRPFLNMLGHRYAGLNSLVTSAFGVIAKGIHVVNGGGDPFMFPMAVDRLSSVMHCDQQTALAEIVEVVRKLDVEICGIEIVERDAQKPNPLYGVEILRRNHETNQETRLFIRSSHKNDRDENVVFDFLSQESEGTIRLASLVACLLCAL